jgi:hypothetical protein
MGFAHGLSMQGVLSDGSCTASVRCVQWNVDTVLWHPPLGWGGCPFCYCAPRGQVLLLFEWSSHGGLQGIERFSCAVAVELWYYTPGSGQLLCHFLLDGEYGGACVCPRFIRQLWSCGDQAIF